MASDERLEVQIEEVIDKWAGSLEIGVTTHAPGTFSLPGTMTNVTSGTWMFSGGAIVHNGVTILEAYGRSIVSYKVSHEISLIMGWCECETVEPIVFLVVLVRVL